MDMTSIIVSAIALFLCWRTLLWSYRLITGTIYHDEYEWWFAWRPKFLYGPDEWDRERALNASPRLRWGCWLLRMRCRPKFYYIRPNWKGSRYGTAGGK